MFGISALSQVPFSSLAGTIVFAEASVDAFATVTADGVKVKPGSGSIVGDAFVTANGGVVYQGDASVNGQANVSCIAFAILDGKGAVAANADFSAKGGIIGEEWGDSEVVPNNWTNVPASEDIWSVKQQDEDSWVRQ